MGYPIQGVVALAILMVAAANANAGRVYGNIIEANGRPVASGTPVTVTCNGQVFSSAVGEYGRYNVNVNSLGSCILQINQHQHSVISYQDSMRFDFQITGNGLKRR